MAARADDLRYYYSQGLYSTVALEVDTTARQTADAVGALRPGRYLISALVITGRCWLQLTPFVKAQAASIVVPSLPAAGASAEFPSFPLDSTSGIKSVYVHIYPNRNDRVQAICASGGCTLLITRVGE